jgi:sugar transferase (PEP-CTERM/EpsH1 system associated)
VTGNHIPLVVHVIYSLGTGGLENGLVNVINRTPQDRYQHAIICLTTAEEFAQRITVPGVRVLELYKKEGHDWGMYRRLLKILRELRPDIIHTRNLAALDVQVLGLLLPGVRRVHGEHGRDIYDLEGKNWKYRQLRKFMRLFVDRYIAVSRDLEVWLLQSIGVRRQRVHQIYNGVDSEKFRPRKGERPQVFPTAMSTDASSVVIGSVGRLVEVKDQQLILRAVSLMLEQAPEWRRRLRIALVGDGPLRVALERQIDQLGLTGLVWLAGNRDDIPTLLQAMDLFVLPSLGEGISNTILEAMAAGLPVIATDVGGNRELVKEGVNGRLFPVGDAMALCAILNQLVENDVERHTMGRESVQFVRQRFDWNQTVAEYLHVYDGLLDRVTEPDPGKSGVTCVDEMGAR